MQKRRGRSLTGPAPFPFRSRQKPSTKEGIVSPGAVGEDCRVNHLTAGTAFPGFKRPDKVVILFRIHPATAFGTFHGVSSWGWSKPSSKLFMSDQSLFTACANEANLSPQTGTTTEKGKFFSFVFKQLPDFQKKRVPPFFLQPAGRSILCLLQGATNLTFFPVCHSPSAAAPMPD